MAFLTTGDGTRIFYKDLGERRATPFVLSHGWPLSSDAWDGQILALLEEGFRVIAYDRRGHGRSEDAGAGHDLDTYADDLAELMGRLGVRGAIMVGHSTGGGELARYVGEYGTDHVAKVVLVSMAPRGAGLAAGAGWRQRLMQNRSQFYLDLGADFYEADGEGRAIGEGLRLALWQQGMMGSVFAHDACIQSFTGADHTADLAAIDMPTLIIHGSGDRIVPIERGGPLSVNIVPEAELIVYEGAPHGLAATHRDRLNADLIAFARRSKPTFFFE